MTRSVIDPITRIEGHLRVEMEVENGVVADAWVSGGCFRGMELVVQNRTPEDAAQIVERICGVCPVSHAHASSIAGDKAYGITISNNARIVRNLLEGAQFLHSHILWLYNLAALDYVNPLNALQANVDDAYAVALENGLALHSDLNQLYEKLAAFADNGQLSIFSGNWFDADGGEAYVDNPEANLILTSHYLEALKMQARSSEMAALLGGKMPHVMTSIPGGNMWVPTESKLDDLLAMATEVRDWVNDTVLADTVMLAKLYPEVLTFGKGCGRYIAWGVFEGDEIRAVVRWSADAEGLSAEFGVVVEERFQRLGLASRLMRHIEAEVFSRGVGRLSGLVLRENAGMNRLMTKLGYAANESDEPDSLVWSKTLRYKDFS